MLYGRLSARENFSYLGALKGLTRAAAGRSGERLLERFGIAEQRDLAVQKLSRGTQQKVALAALLLHAPRVVLLDEPFVLLDTMTVSLLAELLHELADEGCTVLVATHQLDAAEQIARTIIMMDGGRVVRVADRAALLREFSDDGYLLELRSPLDVGRLRVLAELAGTRHVVDGARIVVCGNATQLTAVLNAIGPACVLSIMPRRIGLANIMATLSARSRTAAAHMVT
jgi:ABC-2 type transport system ATP-binding protein